METKAWCLPITWAKTDWLLDKRRVLIQPSQKLLILSDIHIGYYSSLRSNGSYLPTYDAQILQETIQSLVTDYPGFHWIIAGDIKHNHKAEISQEEYNELKTLLKLITKENKLTIIMGNHDKGLKQIIHELDIVCVITDSYSFNDIIINHKEDVVQQKSNKNYIVGHYHPILSTESIKGIFVPVFALREDLLILPAFNYVAGGFNIKNLLLEQESNKDFIVYAVRKHIYPLGSLKNLK